MGLENWTIQKILDEGDVDKALAAKVHSGMFKGSREKQAFELILDHQKSYGKTPDRLTVEGKTSITWDDGMPKEPMEFFLKEMHNRVLHEALAEGQADIVGALKARDPREARKLLGELMSTTSSMDGNDDVTYREVYGLDAQATRLAKYERVKTMGSTIDGIPTPWERLSNTTMGWHEEELILVVGRSGTGKSWYLLLCAKEAWLSGKKVMFVTFEMAEDIIGRRLDALIAELPYSDFKRGELGAPLEAKYKKKMAELESKGGFIVVSGGWASTVPDIERIIKQEKPDMVFIDGVYLMDDGMKTPEPWKKVQNVADQLKQLNQRVGIPIMGSAQFNRNVNLKKMTGGLESIGGADRLGQNADIVIGLFNNDELRAKKQLVARLLKVREDEMISMTLDWDFQKPCWGEIEVSSEGDEDDDAADY